MREGEESGEKEGEERPVTDPSLLSVRQVGALRRSEGGGRDWGEGGGREAGHRPVSTQCSTGKGPREE